MSAGGMRRLYRPQTEEQLRIMAYLIEAGVTRSDVGRVWLLGPDKVRLRRAGSTTTMTVEVRDGKLVLDMDPEDFLGRLA